MKKEKHPLPSGKSIGRLGKAAAMAAAMLLLAAALIPPLFQKQAQEPPEPDWYSGEQAACTDSNADAMLWRLRLIRSAQDRLILSTFDLRPDETGLDILAALQEAADRGVRIQGTPETVLSSPEFARAFHMKGGSV